MHISGKEGEVIKTRQFNSPVNRPAGRSAARSPLITHLQSNTEQREITASYSRANKAILRSARKPALNKPSGWYRRGKARKTHSNPPLLFEFTAISFQDNLRANGGARSQRKVARTDNDPDSLRCLHRPRTKRPTTKLTASQHNRSTDRRTGGG